jgi:hypothetical protein
MQMLIKPMIYCTFMTASRLLNTTRRKPFLIVFIGFFIIITDFFIPIRLPKLPFGSTIADTELDNDPRNANKSMGRLEDVSSTYADLKSKFNTIVKESFDAQQFETSAEGKTRLAEVHTAIEAIKTRNDSSEQCGVFNCSQLRTVYFHTFWSEPDGTSHSSSIHKRIMFMNIASYLHTQNLCCTKLIVWTSDYFGVELEASLRSVFAHYIQKGSVVIRKFDLKVLCKFGNPRARFYTSFAHHRLCRASLLNLEKYVFYDLRMYYGIVIAGLSDLVRFFVLDLYGGIYVDGNYIFDL